MEIENIDVGLLIPYDNNPRLNDGAVDGVAASIKEFGFKVPLVIDASLIGATTNGQKVTEFLYSNKAIKQ